MPFVLLIIGVTLITAGLRDTQDTLFGLLEGEFEGPSNFLYWVVIILIVGAVGYVPKLKPVSTGFLVLILLVLFLKRGNPTGAGGGFFSKFISGINTGSGSFGGASTTTPVTSASQNLVTQNLLQQLSSNLTSSTNLLNQDISANPLTPVTVTGRP